MNKKVRLTLLLTVLGFLMAKPSYCATEVRARQEKEKVFTNISVSDSYEQCMNMKSKEGESLYGTTVVPHLTTNKDWGAVAFLAYSSYGLNGTTTGVDVSIEAKDGTVGTYTSINGNITGVMDLGKTSTQTASLLNGYPEQNELLNLMNNLETRFVEKINGYWYGGHMNVDEDVSWAMERRYDDRIARGPIVGREGLLTACFGASVWSALGTPNSVATFRPMLWNK